MYSQLDHFVPESSPFEVEVSTEMVKRSKWHGVDQISVELIQERGKTLCFEIYKLINFFLE
jgi:hypothetical protein